jgi:hypothetical protein
MPLNKKKTPVTEAARDCCLGVLVFCRDVESTLGQFGIDPEEHRTALCMFAWAMTSAIVRGAGFKTAEHERLKSLIDAELEAKWAGQSIDVHSLKQALQTTGKAYEHVKEQWSQVRTAAMLAEIYVASLQPERESAGKLLTMIAPMCAHRLVSEIYRLTELRTRRSIQWALVATMVTLCQFSSMAGPDESAAASPGSSSTSVSGISSRTGSESV